LKLLRFVIDNHVKNISVILRRNKLNLHLGCDNSQQ